MGRWELDTNAWSRFNHAHVQVLTVDALLLYRHTFEHPHTHLMILASPSFLYISR